MARNDRALVEVGYIYTFVISALLMAGMVLVTSNIMVSADERTTQQELAAITDYALAAIEDVRALAASHPNAEFEKTIELPALHNGKRFSIDLDNTSATVTLTGAEQFTRELAVSKVPISNTHHSFNSGGTYRIVYDPDEGAVAVRYAL